MQNATIELRVRFNAETEQIEVLSGDAVLGTVEKEIWETWVAPHVAAAVDKFKTDLDEYAKANPPVPEAPVVTPVVDAANPAAGAEADKPEQAPEVTPETSTES